MLTGYVRAAMRRARYEILPDDGTYYGEILGFQGLASRDPSSAGSTTTWPRRI